MGKSFSNISEEYGQFIQNFSKERELVAWLRKNMKGTVYSDPSL